MVSGRLKAVAVFVIAMALLQVLVEDLLVFLGATGASRLDAARSPLLVMAIPLAIGTLLFVVLVGGATLSANSLR